jgi:hypothetical protein
MMSDDIPCPACGTLMIPEVQVENVAICRVCGASLVVQDDGQTSRAQLSDLDRLPPGDRVRLTRARSAIARPRGLKGSR